MPQQPSGTLGTAGVTMNAFADTLGQFLLAKINNDQAAKRQKEDDRRGLMLLGFQSALKDSPELLADTEFTANFFKESGFGQVDPGVLQNLARVGLTARQRLDAEALERQQAQEQFNALAFGGPMPQPGVAQAAPASPVGVTPLAPGAAGPQQVSPAGPPQVGVPMPQPPLQPQAPLNAFDPTQPASFDEAQFNKFGQPLELPAPPPVPAPLLSQLGQLARLAPGRDLTVRSPDGKSTLKIDRDAGLSQIANQLMASGMRPFDVYRNFQQHVGGAGLPEPIRDAAAIDGLAMIMDQEAAAVQAGAKPSMNLRGALDTLRQQGLFMDPARTQKLMEPIAQGILAGHKRRLEAERQALLSQAEKLKDTAPQQANELLNQILARQDHEALRLTDDQMDGLGLFPEQRAALLDKPSSDEILMDLAVSQSSTQSGDLLESVIRMEREKAQIEAEAAATRTTEVAKAEKAFNLRQSQPLFAELGASLAPAFKQGIFDKFYSWTRGDLARYARQRESLTPLLARGILSDKGTVDMLTAERALALLPPAYMFLTNPDEALADLQAFDRIIREQSGGVAFIPGLPTADMQPPGPASDSSNYLDAIGVAPGAKP